MQGLFKWVTGVITPQPVEFITLLRTGRDKTAHLVLYILEKTTTPLKTNIFPENQWLEDVFPTELVGLIRGHFSFQGCSS